MLYHQLQRLDDQRDLVAVLVVVDVSGDVVFQGVGGDSRLVSIETGAVQGQAESQEEDMEVDVVISERSQREACFLLLSKFVKEVS